MKLIIDISEEEMKYPANIIQAVKHGIPFDKLRAEIDEIPLSEPMMSADGLTCYGSKSISIRHFRGKVLEIIDCYRNEVKA